MGEDKKRHGAISEKIAAAVTIGSGVFGIWSCCITIFRSYGWTFEGFAAWTSENASWILPLSLLVFGFMAGWSTCRALAKRRGLTAENIEKLTRERDEAVGRSVDRETFDRFKTWEAASAEFMAMPRDRKQFLIELMDGEQHRIPNSDRRRMNAAELLNAQGYIDYLDRDNSGRIFQISPETRVKLKAMADEWREALEEDRLPDDSIFAACNQLEYDEPVDFTVGEWEAPAIVRDWLT